MGYMGASHAGHLGLGLLALLAIGLGSCSAQTETSRPSAFPLATAAPPTPTPTRPSASFATSADSGLVAMVPSALGDRCESIDLSDAISEVVCSGSGVELYLAQWETEDDAISAVSSSLDAAECDALDVARGTITVGKNPVGRGGGCADAPEFAFVHDHERIEGNIFVQSGSFEDAQAWFREFRPTLPAKGTIGGAALRMPLGGQSLAQLRKAAERVAYRTLLRKAEDYDGRLLYFRAEVLQETDDGALVLVTRRDGIWRDVVFVSHDSLERLIEGDFIEFAGLGAGIYTYVSVLGDERDVPAIDAIDLVIRD